MQNSYMSRLWAAYGNAKRCTFNHFIHLRPIHSQVITHIGSISSAHFYASPTPCSLGPLRYACPPKQVAVRPSTSHPQATRSFMVFHVGSSAFKRGEQTLRLTTLLTSTFQLMTSSDFGAPHFPIPMRHVDPMDHPVASTAKARKNVGHLGSQRKAKAKKIREDSGTIDGNRHISTMIL